MSDKSQSLISRQYDLKNLDGKYGSNIMHYCPRKYIIIITLLQDILKSCQMEIYATAYPCQLDQRNISIWQNWKHEKIRNIFCHI